MHVTRSETMMWKQIAVILACGLLAACGGSGSGDGANTGLSTLNSPPQIAGTPSVAAQVGQVYQFTPVASDADGDALTFSIQNRPEWATFSPITGRLDGTPPSTASRPSTRWPTRRASRSSRSWPGGAA